MATSAPSPQRQSLKVVSHTGLIYWWPVWLVGFILAFLSYIDGDRLAVVPTGTTATADSSKKTFQLTVPNEPTPSLLRAAENTANGQAAFPIAIARSTNNYGMIYFLVVLVVLFGSNVPLRGLASIVGILFLVLLTLLFAYLNWWTAIVEYLGGLHVGITVAGYLFPSVVLLVVWLATVFLYDPLRYMTFTPGQFVLHKEVGDLREMFDITQVEVEKRRTDLFRHWVLGLGAGDLIIKVPSQSLQIELPNVLFIDSRVTQIGNLMKTKPVVPA